MSLLMTLPNGSVLKLTDEHADAFMASLAESVSGPAKPKMAPSSEDIVDAAVRLEEQQERIANRLRLRRPFAHRAAANGRHKSVLELLTREDDKAFVKALIQNSEWTFMLQVWKETPPPEGGSQAHTAAGKLFVRVQKALRQVGFPLQQLEVKRGLPFGRGRGAKKGTGYRLTDVGRQWLSKAQSETDASV